jgi:drug/metabolite transporter (DMT)-like permease
MTQVLARTTSLIDGRHDARMTGRLYLRGIVPIGILTSLSLICGNLTYLYLSVAFIQMLKATTPATVFVAAVLVSGKKFDVHKFRNILFIVAGVLLASLGEVKFVLLGVLLQIGGIVFESLRLALVTDLLDGHKMDPLTTLYYTAPVCAVMNAVVALAWEVPKVSMADFEHVGFFNLFANALLAFCLNVSAVYVVSAPPVRSRFCSSPAIPLANVARSDTSASTP